MLLEKQGRRRKEWGVQGEVGSWPHCPITVTPFDLLCPHRGSLSRVSMAL